MVSLVEVINLDLVLSEVEAGRWQLLLPLLEHGSHGGLGVHVGLCVQGAYSLQGVQDRGQLPLPLLEHGIHGGLGVHVGLCVQGAHSLQGVQGQGKLLIPLLEHGSHGKLGLQGLQGRRQLLLP